MTETRLSSLAGRWVAVAAVVALLWRSGRGALSGPPAGGGAALRAWGESRPPVEAALALIRLLALGAGGYLLIIVTIAMVGRAVDHRPTHNLALRLTPPGLRPLLAMATTATIVAGLTAGLAGAADAAPPPSPPILRWVAPSGAPSPSTLPTPTTSPGQDAPSSPRHPTVPPAGRRPATHPDPGGRAAAHYVVRPGDSFWSIAAARLATTDEGNEPAEELVARYWQRLVRANLVDLPVPGQPDLLFPGDRLTLPPLA